MAKLTPQQLEAKLRFAGEAIPYESRAKGKDTFHSKQYRVGGVLMSEDWGTECAD